MRQKVKIEMNKTKSINRLLLFMILWMLGAPYIIYFILPPISVVQSYLLSQLVVLLPVLGYLLIKRIKITEWIPFGKIKFSTFWMIVLFTILIYPLIQCINLFSMLFATNYVAGNTEQLMPNSFWVNLLMIAVLPALMEELIFRGIFYHAYREKGVIIGAVGCGVAFGLMHMNFNQFCYAAVLGVIFCALIEATGSIFSSIIAHFLINGWSVFIIAVQKPLLEATGQMESAAAVEQVSQQGMVIIFGVFAVVALIGTSLAACVLVWISKHCGRKLHLKWCIRHGKSEKGWKGTFLTPAWGIAAVISIVYMILIEIIQ